MISSEELAEVRRRFEAASTPAARAAHWSREWKRLHRTLPRRVRFRLWRDGRTDKAAGWLIGHGREGCAIALWRVTGLWKG